MLKGHSYAFIFLFCHYVICLRIYPYIIADHINEWGTLIRNSDVSIDITEIRSLISIHIYKKNIRLKLFKARKFQYFNAQTFHYTSNMFFFNLTQGLFTFSESLFALS